MVFPKYGKFRKKSQEVFILSIVVGLSTKGLASGRPGGRFAFSDRLFYDGKNEKDRNDHLPYGRQSIDPVNVENHKKRRAELFQKMRQAARPTCSYSSA